MVFKEIQRSTKRPQNRYGQEVLIGNWFELRLADQIDKRAITPAITGKSECSPHKTTYSSDFATPDANFINDCINSKVDAYGNRMYSCTSRIKFLDGDQFLKNLTTTTDISYRIIPRLICKAAAAAAKSETLEPLQKYDTFGIYGNATQSGLRAWLQCEAKRSARSDSTVTKSDYVPLPVKRIKLRKSRCG